MPCVWKKIKSSWWTTKKINYNKTFPSLNINIWLLPICTFLMVLIIWLLVALSPPLNRVVLTWVGVFIIAPLLGLSVAVYLLSVLLLTIAVLCCWCLCAWLCYCLDSYIVPFPWCCVCRCVSLLTIALLAVLLGLLWCPLFVVSLLLPTLVVPCYLSKHKYQPLQA